MLGPFATTFDLDERVEQTTEPTAEGLWDALTKRLRETLGEEFERWFAYAEPQSLSNGALHVSLPNDFTREWVEGHFRNAVANAARDSLGRELAVSFEVSDRSMVTAGASASPVPTGHRASRREQPPLSRRCGGAESQVHVRPLRHRLVQPVRARGRAGRRGGAGTGVQPAVHLRRHRPREDAPPAGDRALRPAALATAHEPLHHLRDVHERLHRGGSRPRSEDRGLQAPLPELRRPPHRRHPVPRGQGADPGGVLPHLQLALRGGGSRSSSRRTARRGRSRRSRSDSARGSSGASSPISRSRISRRASRSC